MFFNVFCVFMNFCNFSRCGGATYKPIQKPKQMHTRTHARTHSTGSTDSSGSINVVEERRRKNRRRRRRKRKRRIMRRRRRTQIHARTQTRAEQMILVLADGTGTSRTDDPSR